MKCFVLTKRTLLLIAVCILAGIAGIITVSKTVSVFKVDSREIPIYSVEREDNKIALTFDCAWNADDIQSICDTLDKYNAKATFFAVGDWAEKYPDAVKMLYNRGHEIGNHSYNHAHYKKLSKDQMLADMDKCDGILKSLTGKQPTLFRSPYGEYNNEVITTCDTSNRTYIQWSVDGIDYGDAKGSDIVSRSTKNTKNGDIILLHNGTKHTASVLPEILETLSKEHTLVTVSDLIYADNYKIDHAGRQFKTTP